MGMLVVEKLPAPVIRRGPASAPAGAPSAPAAAPERPATVAVLDGDVLVLRLGGAPGLAAAPAPAAPPQKAPAKPAPAPQTPAPPTHDTYVVQPGDTLSGIAQRELGSAQLAGELARLNKLSDPGAIRVGQVLKLR